MTQRIFSGFLSVFVAVGLAFGPCTPISRAEDQADSIGTRPTTAAPGVLPSLQQNEVRVETEIPSTPSSAPSLYRKAPAENFRCKRTYLYDGKSYGCDSNVRRDGEGLRPALEEVPASVSSLNTYQRNRSALEITAFAGTLGVAAMLAGALTGAGNTKSLLLLSGGGLLAGGFLLGFFSLRSNEGNLDQAIQTHNDAMPQKPIQMQISTGIHF